MSFDKRVWKGALFVSVFLVLSSASAAAWDPTDMQNDMQQTFDAAFDDGSDVDAVIDESDDNTVRQFNQVSETQRTTSGDTPSWFSSPDDSDSDAGDDSDSSASDSSVPSWFSSSPSDDGISDISDDIQSGSDGSDSGSSVPSWGASPGDSDSGSSDDQQDDSNVQAPSDDDGQDSVDTNPSGGLAEQAESIAHDLINQERQQRGISTMSHDSSLQTTARAKSQDMADRNYFAHTSPTGEGFRDLFNQYGVSCTRGGENLAQTWVGQTVATGDGGSVHYDDAQNLAEGLVRQWLNSPAHRDAMLRDSYNSHGIGIEITGSDQVYATSHFCT